MHLHRDLRLRALRDAPDSFGETFADAAARPTSYWEGLTRSLTEPGRHVMFLACEGQRELGSAYGLLDRDQSDAGRVGGMWVDPASRRRGVKTGTRRPLPTNPSFQIAEMECQL